MPKRCQKTNNPPTLNRRIIKSSFCAHRLTDPAVLSAQLRFVQPDYSADLIKQSVQPVCSTGFVRLAQPTLLSDPKATDRQARQ